MKNLIRLTKKSKKKIIGDGLIVGDPQGKAAWITNGKWAVRMDRTDLPTTRDGILGHFGLNGDTRELTEDMLANIMPDLSGHFCILDYTPWTLDNAGTTMRLFKGTNCFTFVDQDFVKLFDLDDEILHVHGLPSGETLQPLAFMDQKTTEIVLLVMPIKSELSIDELPSVQ